MTDLDTRSEVVTPTEPTPAPTQTATRRWKVERRLETSFALEAGGIVVGLILAVLSSAVLITLADAPVIESFQALIEGAVGSRNSALETLVQATPLIFTGLAAAFAFRAKVWNIGGEGQLFAGAMGAYFAWTIFGDGTPKVLLLVLIMGFAAIGGALWAGLAAALQVRFGVNVIIATVMLNFVILNVVSFLLSDVWQDPASFYYQTARMDDVAALPRIVDASRLHLGFVIALFLAALVWFILERTSFGYEVRGVGVNDRVANYGGIGAARIIMLTMLVSGAIAGLAGGSELSGLHLRLQLDISNQLGFTGIIIALVARLRPVGVIVAAIVAGALTNGATTMQLSTGVPAALVDVIKGSALVFVLVAAVAVKYRIRKVGTDG